MGNCLVTKLRDVIDNPALPKLGTIRFTLEVGRTPTRNNVFHATENNKSLLTIISGPVGGTIKAVREPSSSDVDKGTSFYLDISLDSYTFSVPGTYVIEITNKYFIKTFRVTELITCNTEEFKSLSALQGTLTLSGPGVTGKLKDLIKNTITEYVFTRLNVSGSLTDFAGRNISTIICTSLELMTGDISVFSGNQSLTVLALNGSFNVAGSISQINNIPNLTNFQCAGDPKITGSLADLLNNGALINPKLNTLVVTNTNNITKNDSDVNTLRSLGVNVVL